MHEFLVRLHDLLFHPAKVFWVCLVIFTASLLLDGTFIKLWRLERDRTLLTNRIEQAKTKSKQLEFRIHEAYQTEFIERQARDQLDLVREGDLVFVFSEDAGI